LRWHFCCSNDHFNATVSEDDNADDDDGNGYSYMAWMGWLLLPINDNEAMHMRSKLEGGGMGRYQELQDERSVEETQPWPQSRPQDQCPPLPELPFPSTSLLLLFCRCFILQREKKSFY